MNIELSRKCLLDLPDEMIEGIVAFLSFDELSSLYQLGNKRLYECAKRASKKKPFRKNSTLNNSWKDEIEAINLSMKKKFLNLQLNQIIQTIFSINIFQVSQSSVDPLVLVIIWMMLKWFQSKMIPFLSSTQPSHLYQKDWLTYEEVNSLLYLIKELSKVSRLHLDCTCLQINFRRFK